ncbi:hypothetical protein [Kribbella qitaiheensis]|uniref:hypothetical protein n=1 Tax=Kribbella qitaiheensis TaxID=1544730 RepID=UPI001FEA7219|nr:hypothetical protein [Kribbella qitaiheensis]
MVGEHVAEQPVRRVEIDAAWSTLETGTITSVARNASTRDTITAGIPRQMLTQVRPGVDRTENTASASTTMPRISKGHATAARTLHRRIDQYAEWLDDEQDRRRMPPNRLTPEPPAKR